MMPRPLKASIHAGFRPSETIEWETWSVEALEQIAEDCSTCFIWIAAYVVCREARELLALPLFNAVVVFLGG